jgi:ATP-binding cassette subfamily B (MDR/TAP) protein 1
MSYSFVFPWQAAPNIQYFAKGQAAGGRMYSVINRKPAIRSTESEKVLEKLVGEIALEGIRFAYPARPDVEVFKSFSLRVPAGKTVALVGSSG